jgi:hypothetical protein
MLMNCVGTLRRFVTTYHSTQHTLVAQVVLFVTASPELSNWNESVAALTFASRCRAVDLYGGGGAKVPVSRAHGLQAAADTEAELAAANKKIAELTQALLMSNRGK